MLFSNRLIQSKAKFIPVSIWFCLSNLDCFGCAASHARKQKCEGQKQILTWINLTLKLCCFLTFQSHYIHTYNATFFLHLSQLWNWSSFLKYCIKLVRHQTLINPVKKIWMAVDRVQDGEKDSRNFLPLSHCSSRVAFPRVHFCQRVTIYDTATVTGLCAATAAAAAANRRRHGRQPRRIFQVLVAVQSTILTVTNDALYCSPPSWLFFFKNLLLYTLEGKWCFLLFRYFLYSHRALFFGGKFICPQFSFLTDDHAPVLLLHRWQRLIPPSDPLFPSHLKLKNLSIVSIISLLSSFSSATQLDKAFPSLTKWWWIVQITSLQMGRSSLGIPKAFKNSD